MIKLHISNNIGRMILTLLYLSTILTISTTLVKMR